LTYQLFFVLNFYLIFLVMKITSWSLLTHKQRPKLLPFLFTTPLLSARAYAQTRFHKAPLLLTIFKFLLSLFFLFCVIFVAKNFLQPLNYAKMILICPMIYLFTEVLGSLGQLLFYPASRGIPPIHRHPLQASSLGDFWGRRWNFWVRDWLVDISKSSRKNLAKKLLLTFFVSGIFHELLANFPHFLYSRELTFGNMTLYFIVQALGLWIEKKWLSELPMFFKRVYLWVVVILPAPLFINRPLLIFFGIVDG